MSWGVTCDCSLCNIEVRLLCDLSTTQAGAFRELFSGCQGLRQYSSVSPLLLHLRMSPANAGSASSNQGSPRKTSHNRCSAFYCNICSPTTRRSAKRPLPALCHALTNDP